MSEQGFRGVPGVPDGWELVGIRQIEDGEWSLAREPYQWSGKKSYRAHPVIRKIEEPAKYRPFASAEEFKPHRDRWVLLGAGVMGRVLSFSDDYVSTSDAHPEEYTWEDAFEDLVFEDGSPFGVRIDE